MISMRGYRWGAWLFGLTGVACVAAMPYAVNCCSHLPDSDLLSMEPYRRSPYITPVAAALLDWPMGFRLLLMTLAAAVICFSSTLASMFLIQNEPTEAGTIPRKSVVQAILACLQVGVLYILATYAVGFLGYRGPLNLLWGAGVPAAIAAMVWPRLGWIRMTIPLAIGGWAALAAISIGFGIPLD